jgi:hypothetical protein
LAFLPIHTWVRAVEIWCLVFGAWLLESGKMELWLKIIPLETAENLYLMRASVAE